MNEHIKIQLNKEDILILKTDLLIHPKIFNQIHKDITKQAKEGVVIIPNHFSYEIVSGNKMAYEDTEISPEQISAMMAHNTALIEQLAEYEELEEKDLLLRLPYPLTTKCLYWACKEDRMVYYLNARKFMPCKFSTKGTLFYRIDDYVFTNNDFGKVLFLKELDAEQALAKMLEEK